MHKIIITKLGPIQYCEMPIQNTTILTGYQASGKSTIAKAIYFFRTLKDDLYQLILRRCYSSGLPTEESTKLTGDFESMARNKFLSTFGTSYSMDLSMNLTYFYTQDTKISISLRKDYGFLTPNYVWIDYTASIRGFLSEVNFPEDKNQLKMQLDSLFDDPYETVYIPAGRSVLTVLGDQFNYFYSTMDDAQKRLLDSCTRDYLERVMRLRPQFANGLEGLLEGKQLTQPRNSLYLEAISLIRKILKGTYSFSGGEERIWVDKTHYVKMNFASSGQQESIWILNLLYYYLVQNAPVNFIIEEPESNLFPESQKLIIELISLVANAGNAVLLTTHSPYVLGEINNLLYAGYVQNFSKEETAHIISKCKWMEYASCDARFVCDGQANSCMDSELMQIDNFLLDGISGSINEEYDRLFAIACETEEK